MRLRLAVSGTVALLAAGCTATSVTTPVTTPATPPPLPPTAPTVLSTTYSPPPATTPPTTTPRTTTVADGVLPAALVGSWSRTEDQAEFVYRFLPDGRFRTVEILSQPRPEGIFEYLRRQDGRADVVGSRLVLRVSSVTASRTDPEDPAGDYTDRPRTPEDLTYTWRASGTTLSLESADGVVLVLRRQP